MDSMLKDRYFKRSPGSVENIRKLYNLDKPGRIEESINILVEWIEKQDHIIKKDFSKHMLEFTLITCKGSVEKAKKQIDRLCTMKTLMPKFFTKSNIKMELESIIDMAKIVPLPTLTDDYYRIILIQLKQFRNIRSDMFLQYFQLNFILVEYLKTNDYINGYIVIFDLRDINLLELLTKMDTVEFQQVVSILIEGYGARIKAAYLLTDSKAVELLVKLLKQFLSEKLCNRLHVLRSIEELHKAVPKEMLPEEYGGNEISLDKLHEVALMGNCVSLSSKFSDDRFTWKEWLIMPRKEELINELSSEKHVEYMKIMNKAGSDESKRHSGKFNEEYMGMPGAFRNLSVD